MAPATATSAGITYDCDTAADHFSELVLSAPAVPFTVTGNVQLRTLGGSAKYVPLVRVQVASAAQAGVPPANYAGFSLMAMSIDPKKSKAGQSAIQMLSYNLKGKEDEGLPNSVMTNPARNGHEQSN